MFPFCTKLSVFICCILTVFAVKAQSCKVECYSCSENSLGDINKNDDAPHQVSKLWGWGLGHANVLDTYLSPLEYTGTDFAMYHRTLRLAHWGKGKWIVMGNYSLHVAYLQSPTDDGREWDTEISAAGGLLRSWHIVPQWRIAAGGLVEVSGGGTYNTRNGNNPAQGRIGTHVEAAISTDWTFRIAHKTGTLSLLVSAPFIGVQFAPEYGQSYYEIFSLGHTSGIIHITHPRNAPTFQMHAQAADIRQSKLSGLRRHAWRNGFLIGFQRTLRIVR